MLVFHCIIVPAPAAVFIEHFVLERLRFSLSIDEACIGLGSYVQIVYLTAAHTIENVINISSARNCYTIWG